MPSLLASTRSWSASTRRAAALACVAIGLPLAIWRGLTWWPLFALPDASAYLDMAAGRPAMLPFAWRPLVPRLVHGLQHWTHLPLQAGFTLEGLAALALFFGSILALLLRSGAPRWMLPAILGLFFWSMQLNGLVLPDLTFAALLAVMLLLLAAGRLLPATLLLFPLALTRESALLVLVCLLLAGRRRLRSQEAASACAATLAGLLCVHLLARHALPDREHLSPLLYLAGKLPWNGLRNLFGLEPWANLYPACPVPRWQISVPFGALHAVGLCGLDPHRPLRVLTLAGASFGLLPLLLFRLPRRAAVAALPLDLLLRFTLLYGAASFLLAPFLGDLVARLFAFGWPLFLVAVPLLVVRSRANFTSNSAALAFLALHLLAAWSAAWTLFLLRIPQSVAVLLLYAAGGLLLQKTWRASPRANPQNNPPESPSPVL